MRDNLHCIATGHDDRWEAFGLDLDLAVQGSSFDEVRGFLDKAIHMYIGRAMEEPEPTRTQLLSRKAPLSVRLSWGLRLFRSVISDTTGRDLTIGFPVACHA
jgi:hypothetical protein